MGLGNLPVENKNSLLNRLRKLENSLPSLSLFKRSLVTIARKRVAPPKADTQTDGNTGKQVKSICYLAKGGDRATESETTAHRLNEKKKMLKKIDPTIEKRWWRDRRQFYSLFSFLTKVGTVTCEKGGTTRIKLKI
eukprot:TRINITY_DN43_c2_g1_i1.p1 TRINITY_DN43_c2_g1~~TRINITY_DN43_c2_g1_i1.p1  ORF type:complete len:136 (-),score=10.56 TRINITY_DN43_c2_g1_i1:237-644(-)